MSSKKQPMNVMLLTLILASTPLQNCWGGSWSSFQNGGRLSETVEAGSTAPVQFDMEWTIDIPGYGQSSPVHWKGTIYVTSVEGPQKETYFISAYSAETAAMLWAHQVKNATPQESSSYVSKAAPTPVVDQSGVYVFFEGGNLLKLSHEGKPVWQRNLVKEFGSIESRHGLGASLEHNAESIFVWVERSEEPYVLSVDKMTGKDRWKTAGVGATSWSSPRLIPIDDSESHLVLSAIGSLTGIDPESGKVLWTFDQIAGNSTPTPIPFGQGKFLIGATVGRGGNDAGLRPAESNGVVEIKSTEEGWKAEFVWRAAEATSSFGSPIIHQDRAYFVNKTGVLFCLDANTGQEQAKARIGGSLWATPLAIGSRLYLFTKDGVLKIYTTDEPLKQISERTIFQQPEAAAENPFGGKTLYAAIHLKDGFLIRSAWALYRLKDKAPR
ncbi:MAG: PQQ-binding-like beta-propeller repeat protein [Planctomycetaceae bacterium]|nr:PQQ-binding-like beta-propeller repeat protein [Planctomycetaceae bacterium]